MREGTAGHDASTATTTVGAPRRDWFLARWFVSVAVTLAVAGLVEYGIGARLLADRLLEDSAQHLMVHTPHMEEVLAADLTPDERTAAVRAELQDIVDTGYGTTYAALFDASGRQLAAAVPTDESVEHDDAVDPVLLRQALRTGRPVVVEEREEGEAGSDQYEFLLPLGAPDGGAVLEIDLQDSVVGQVAADLRWNLLLGVVVALLVSVPLSYLLGGRRLHRAQRVAQRAANVDPLTGLAARRPFRGDVEAALRAGRPAALALVDLDEFKQVNDRLGHSYGDQVLVALAGALDAVRAGDTAYRLGGDEFAVLLPGADEPVAVAVLDRVREALTAALPGIGFSCGVAAAAPGDETAVQALWERADAALYEAKRTGRGRTATFSDTASPLTISPRKVRAVHDLLADGCPLTVAFQPVWDLHRGELLGHEALLRLPDDAPLDGPQEAFDLAQRLGRAAELDRRARDTVLRCLPRTGWHGLLFLNVHPAALTSMDLPALVDGLAAAGLVPGDVVLEVTEQADLDHPEPIRTLRAARQLGFRLALDDMGRSNAGLRALTLVRFDVVKVDRQVVADLGSDPAAEATVAAAATFVRRTGGWVVAEGIEDLAMLDAVTLGAEDGARAPTVLAGQGFLLGRPAPDPLPAGSTLSLGVRVSSPAGLG